MVEIQQRGFSKQNLKNLFKKPTLQDMIILGLTIMLIWFYLVHNQSINNIFEYVDNNCTCDFEKKIIPFGVNYSSIDNLTKNPDQDDDYSARVDLLRRCLNETSNMGMMERFLRC